MSYKYLLIIYLLICLKPQSLRNLISQVLSWSNFLLTLNFWDSTQCVVSSIICEQQLVWICCGLVRQNEKLHQKVKQLLKTKEHSKLCGLKTPLCWLCSKMYVNDFSFINWLDLYTHYLPSSEKCHYMSDYFQKETNIYNINFLK